MPNLLDNNSFTTAYSAIAVSATAESATAIVESTTSVTSSTTTSSAAASCFWPHAVNIPKRNRTNNNNR